MSGLINNALELNYLIAFIMGWDIKLALFLAPILASVPLRQWIYMINPYSIFFLLSCCLLFCLNLTYFSHIRCLSPA